MTNSAITLKHGKASKYNYTSICEICQTPRSKGDHKKCSRQRQRARHAMQQQQD